jgi:hypothetical protein
LVPLFRNRSTTILNSVSSSSSEISISIKPASKAPSDTLTGFLLQRPLPLLKLGNLGIYLRFFRRLGFNFTHGTSSSEN